VTALGQKHDVLRLGTWRTDDVQGELKWHLLVRPLAVEKGDGRAERLEVQVVNRIFQPVEELRDGLLVDVRLAGVTAVVFWIAWLAVSLMSSGMSFRSVTS
jgi:hypothetical protein